MIAEGNSLISFPERSGTIIFSILISLRPSPVSPITTSPDTLSIMFLMPSRIITWSSAMMLVKIAVGCPFGFNMAERRRCAIRFPPHCRMTNDLNRLFFKQHVFQDLQIQDDSWKELRLDAEPINRILLKTGRSCQLFLLRSHFRGQKEKGLATPGPFDSRQQSTEPDYHLAPESPLVRLSFHPDSERFHIIW